MRSCSRVSGFHTYCLCWSSMVPGSPESSRMPYGQRTHALFPVSSSSPHCPVRTGDSLHVPTISFTKTRNQDITLDFSVSSSLTSTSKQSLKSMSSTSSPSFPRPQPSYLVQSSLILILDNGSTLRLAPAPVVQKCKSDLIASLLKTIHRCPLYLQDKAYVSLGLITVLQDLAGLLTTPTAIPVSSNRAFCGHFLQLYGISCLCALDMFRFLGMLLMRMMKRKRLRVTVTAAVYW